MSQQQKLIKCAEAIDAKIAYYDEHTYEISIIWENCVNAETIYIIELIYALVTTLGIATWVREGNWCASLEYQNPHNRITGVSPMTFNTHTDYTQAIIDCVAGERE